MYPKPSIFKKSHTLLLSQASITSTAPGGKCGCSCCACPCALEVAWDRSRWLSWLGKAVLGTCRDISKAAPEKGGVRGEQTSCFEPPGVVHPLERKTEHENTSKDPSSRQRGAGVELQRELRHPQACERLSVPTSQPPWESHSVLEEKAQGSSPRSPLRRAGCAQLCSSSPTP